MNNVLKQALLKKNEALAKRMINQELSQNGEIENIDEIWKLVCRKDIPNLAKELMVRGEASSIRLNFRGDGPLLYACKNGGRKVAKVLIELGANVNESNSYKGTPLIEACKKGMDEVTKALVEKGANINAVDKFGNTPLIYACTSGNENIAIALLAKGVILKDKFGSIPLMYACQDGMNEVVKALIDGGVNINVQDNDGNTPLVHACVGGNEEIVKMLIGKGANVNIQNKFGNTPLMRACQDGMNEIVKALINGGADINIEDEDGNTALMFATAKEKEEIVKTLKGKMLIDACRNGRDIEAKELVEQGAEVNIIDQDGNTPLLWAWKNGMKEVAQILIDGGADINVKDRFGNTGLMYTLYTLKKNANKISIKRISRKPREIIDILKDRVDSARVVENKINIKIKNDKDRMLLNTCKECKFKEAKELIDKGANCKILLKLSDIQREEVYNNVILKYLNESISNMDSFINKLYYIPIKYSDKEISKVSLELNKIMEVLTDLKKIDKVHKYDEYGNELVQQRIRFMEAIKYIKGKGKSKGRGV
ncbi:MAG: ankyrin repeat domain-containing protein [Clostridiales bacterium]|nr:ankyrin repeat domain-containing protein [Clostridiales bacterium]